MMKKLTAILLSLLLCAAFAAAAAENQPPVTAEDLAAWAAELKALALESAPENDPADESFDTEDGFRFIYSFADLYADRTEMAADTRIAAAVISGESSASFRGVAVCMSAPELINLFPNDNPELKGTREGALLYRAETESGALRYGRVYRDGQRITAVEYGELAPDGDGYHPAVLSCRFAEGLLFSIRAEGFDPASAPLLTEEDKARLTEELAALGGTDEYRAVKTSSDGKELAPFGKEDLAFGDFRFPDMRPEDLPGIPETEEMDDEDGTTLLRAEGDGYTAVFRTGADGQTELVSLSLEDEELEGPRCVRLGDAFHEDLKRFRSEDRGTDGITEVLYGGETGDRGTVNYAGIDGITLRYVTVLDDGREAELLLRYETSTLTEIILHIL